jgi:hypothetical protein
MLLGQLVAISVATNLFFLALVPLAKKRTRAAPPAGARSSVPSVLWLSVLASLVTVSLVPHSLQHDYFLANLLVMHALLVLPLLPLPAHAVWARRAAVRSGAHSHGHGVWIVDCRAGNALGGAELASGAGIDWVGRCVDVDICPDMGKTAGSADVQEDMG